MACPEPAEGVKSPSMSSMLFRKMLAHSNTITPDIHPANTLLSTYKIKDTIHPQMNPKLSYILITSQRDSAPFCQLQNLHSK